MSDHARVGASGKNRAESHTSKSSQSVDPQARRVVTLHPLARTSEAISEWMLALAGLSNGVHSVRTAVIGC